MKNLKRARSASILAHPFPVNQVTALVGDDSTPGRGIRDMIRPEGCGRCIIPTLTSKLNEELNLKLPRRRVTVAETEGN